MPALSEVKGLTTTVDFDRPVLSEVEGLTKKAHPSTIHPMVRRNMT